LERGRWKSLVAIEIGFASYANILVITGDRGQKKIKYRTIAKRGTERDQGRSGRNSKAPSGDRASNDHEKNGRTWNKGLN